MQRVYQFLGQMKWYRKVATNQTVSLGGQVYYISRATLKEQLEIIFCPSCQYLLFRNDKEHLLALHPIKNLNKATLMGKLAAIFSVPNW